MTARRAQKRAPREVARPKVLAAEGSARLLEAARGAVVGAPDPDELVPMEGGELERARHTKVGEAYGITSAEVSRDGRRAIYQLEGRGGAR